MKQRMRYLVLVALAAGTTLVGGCSDDEDFIGDDKGGSAGASGSKTAGSSAGGSANKAGNNSGGKAGNATAGTSAAGTSAAGTSATAGAGGVGEGGAGGATDGGADGNSGGAGGAGGSDGGAAGAGGAGEPALVYKCGSSTLIRKQCSALAAANCDDPTICSDCVAFNTADREAFQLDPPCPACNEQLDAYAQCQVDAFESGDLAFGVQCFEGFGADGSENCLPFLDEAFACQGYVGSDVDPHACPATWPPQ